VLTSRIGKGDAKTVFTELKINCKTMQYFELAGSIEDGKKESPTAAQNDWSSRSNGLRSFLALANTTWSPTCVASQTDQNAQHVVRAGRRKSAEQPWKWSSSSPSQLEIKKPPSLLTV
jgi:hypothetical protein